jgi:4-hydroxy-3-polyprenylbenzoate decarboxylase
MDGEAAGGSATLDYRDLREWLRAVDGMGELRELEQIDARDDIGAITDFIHHSPHSPALLFGKVPGYDPGFRVLVNQLGSRRRLAYSWGLPADLSALELVQAWRERSGAITPIPPEFVETGPVAEHVQEGDDVDVGVFPTPRWHEHDGGPYIGTSCAVFTQDRDTGWVNAGTYRVQVHDRNTLGLMANRSRHARMHYEDYHRRGEPCPVTVSLGQEPMLYLFASSALLPGESELDHLGGFRGEPVELVKSDLTGLPVPARSEIVVEGFIPPGVDRIEGPFGEFQGYYAGGARPNPVIEVKRVWHRGAPILTGDPPVRPPSTKSFYRAVILSAAIWSSLEKAGVPDVRGVWCHEAGATRFFHVVAIRQRYPGHARQAALIASQCAEGLRLGRYVVVVDEDIDPTNLEEVVWAMGTRSDPQRDIDIITRTLTGPLDPVVPPGTPTNAHHGSRAMIDACRPYEWFDEFPRTIGLDPEQRADVVRRFGHLLPLD